MKSLADEGSALFSKNKPANKLIFASSFLIFLTFDLMLLGAGVRSLDAGLACPDWPLCFGQVIPDFHLGVWLEFLHRTVAGLIFILYAIFMTVIFKNFARDGVLKFWAILGFILLISQVMMGALTVLKLLAPGIVTTHLALATLFLGILFLMKKRLEEHRNLWVRDHSPKPQLILVLPVMAVFAQLLLGGTVASTYAGKVCLDFPTCLGQWIPTLQGQIGLQVIHRLGAYFLFFLSLGMALYVQLSEWGKGLPPRLRALSWRFFGLVLLQILIGITSLKLRIPPWIAVLHLAVAILLFRNTLEIGYWGLRGVVFSERTDQRVKSQSLTASG